MAGGVVESAAASYQAEGRIVGRRVNLFGREIRLKVLAHASDPENSRDAVGEPHVNGVPGAQGTEAEEDSRSLVTVDVTFDDRGPDLAGRRRVLIPCRFTGARLERRDLDRAVGVDAQVQQARVHANGRDIDRYRQ